MKRLLASGLAALLVAACHSDSSTASDASDCAAAASGWHWAVQYTGDFNDLFAVWGWSAEDVFAVGDGGTVLHYDGNRWTRQQSGTTRVLYDVWGSSPADVFAVGSLGTIQHFDGAAWTPQSPDTSRAPHRLDGVSGSSLSNVFAVGYSSWGGAVVFRYDGTRWYGDTLATVPGFSSVWVFSPTNTVVTSGDGGIIQRYSGSGWVREREWTRLLMLLDVWASSSAAMFAVGSQQDGNGVDTSVVLHFDGTHWERQASATVPQLRLNAISGVSDGDVFAVGRTDWLPAQPIMGAIFHYDGRRWTRCAPGNIGVLNGVWAAPGGVVYAVGEGGLILRGSR